MSGHTRGDGTCMVKSSWTDRCSFALVICCLSERLINNLEQVYFNCKPINLRFRVKNNASCNDKNVEMTYQSLEAFTVEYYTTENTFLTVTYDPWKHVCCMNFLFLLSILQQIIIII